MKVWINGRRATRIDCRDRGLHYGDGVFETLWAEHGRVRLLGFHLDRLFAGCRRLKMAAPPRNRIAREIVEAARAFDRCTLKLIVSRGVGARGYAPQGLTGATRVLFCYPRHETTGVPATRLRWCRTPIGSNPSLAGLKTLNRLESVLARQEWQTSSIADGLMSDAEGHIVCGTMSNVFIRQKRTLLTPRLDRCGVAGGSCAAG